MTTITLPDPSADSTVAEREVADLPEGEVDFDSTFMALVEPFRSELIAHCYRMFGSVHEAEDMVQETYLKAWRAFHGFENRSSLRTWMYRIATNTCLTALESRQRRPLPSGLGGSNSDPTADLQTRSEVPWLEPLPDSMLWGEPNPDPAAAVITKDSVRLAFVAALQHLTAQQRAVVILRDVLAWRASEVAQTLEISVAAVNSTLQRARAQLSKIEAGDRVELPAGDERLRELLDRYVDAFEKYDVQGIVEILTQDAVFEMPPFDGWYLGPVDIGRLITVQCPAQRSGDMKMIRTSANGSPALGLYMRGADGVHRAFQLQLPTLTESGVSHIVCFFDLDLFERFGLPAVLT